MVRDYSQLQSWHSNWSELRVVVLGLGVTGFSVADTLAELGSKILVIAESAEQEHLDILDVLGVEHLSGKFAEGLPDRVVDFEPDLIITSPGVRPEHELLSWAESQGLNIWVDIDLAWRLRDKSGTLADWITVTGTNGKTTTVQLVEAMLLADGKRAVACGNIGVPILDAIRDPVGLDAIVVELSSFQLHYLGPIEPFASAVLNLANDHIDWHGSFKVYGETKAKIYENTKVACIYNLNDLATEKMVENANVVEGARAIAFTTGLPAKSQIGYVEDILCDRAFLADRANSALELATLDDLSQIGVLTPHLMANVAAASALARACGVAPESIKKAIRQFKLDAHRIQLVAEKNGIRWIDDSKATNPHAAGASLNSFDSIIWIAGGLFKGVEVADLVKKYSSRLKAAVVIGTDTAQLLEALSQHVPTIPVFDIGETQHVMQDAVRAALSMAKAGDTVLLAPAAASMDQFQDYEDRGNQFATQVKLQLEFPA